ncbi:hypothetical protein [Acidithiobacillus ferrianus]|uniref:hypothetical protein n=1 Tax=Acidithiobacillus ferrianus TaxID=2678518 RepID=UPI0034E47A26
MAAKKNAHHPEQPVGEALGMRTQHMAQRHNPYFAIKIAYEKARKLLINGLL